ncbi:MAG: hypothetical protein KY466_03390 [Gemmatimonadetes bacterium]|nr:hypothetical protein [Gemmatimonadota bacterium]
MSRASLSLLAALIAAAACGTNHADDDLADEAPRPGAGGTAPDTARGVVAITGADPLTRVVLRHDDGSTTTLAGAVADTLRQAAGLDVIVTGRRTEHGLEATAFRVLRLERLPATDGRLELEGDVAVLLTADGRRVRFPAAPAALRGLAGRRVWIAGEPGGEPRSWGLLEP